MPLCDTTHRSKTSKPESRGVWLFFAVIDSNRRDSCASIRIIRPDSNSSAKINKHESSSTPPYPSTYCVNTNPVSWPAYLSSLCRTDIDSEQQPPLDATAGIDVPILKHLRLHTLRRTASSPAAHINTHAGTVLKGCPENKNVVA